MLLLQDCFYRFLAVFLATIGIIVTTSSLFVSALDNGVALTPPMGWLSWERFGCQTDCGTYPETCISEQLYLTQAQLLLSDGYQDAGYTYINIDDCWSELERDAITHKIVPDHTRFPHGLLYLSRTLHGMGLKLGVYTDIGTKTCGGYPGMEDYFDLDAQTFAIDYEIDSLKVDACNANESLFNTTYPEFGQALNQTGRPILYSCSWPNDYYERHNHWEDPDYLNHGIKQTCNTWRNYFDVYDDWQSISKILHFWARSNATNVLIRAAGPGHWNDPDMLVVGNPGLSLSEQQVQFSVWAIVAAPLMISADLRTMPQASRDILQNTEIIAVNQDRLGRQGWCAEVVHDYNRVWVRELEHSREQQHQSGETVLPISLGTSDSWAIVLENHESIFNAKFITFDPERHLPKKRRSNSSSENDSSSSWGAFTVRDLIRHEDLGMFQQEFTASVDESSCKMYKIVFQPTKQDQDHHHDPAAPKITANAEALE